MKTTTTILMCSLAAAFLAVSPAQAGPVTISTTPVLVNAGSSGNYFDVVLTNGSAITLLGAFSVGLSVGDPSILFTSATMDTASPYVFSGDSFTLLTLLSNDISTASGAQTLIASDLSNSGAGVSIAAGATVGLGRVFFTATPAASAGAAIQLTFLAFPTTSLSDALGVDIPISSMSAGSIEVATSGVPEPATLLPVSLGLLAVVSFARKRTNTL